MDSIWASASSYLEFNVSSPSTAVAFAFTPSASSNASDKRAYLNALEFDVGELAAQASYPDPADGDEHINADDASYTLSFIEAPNATSYDLYVTTEGAETAGNATTDSPAYVGSISDSSYSLGGLSALTAYWWRVDVVTSDGSVVLGRVWNFRPRRLAFPGADGFGKYAIGGSGGAVVKVTTLEDYDPDSDEPIEGSFRYAVEEVTGPKTIIFEVGGKYSSFVCSWQRSKHLLVGQIALQARLTITDRYVTVAGQTAPGKGIVFTGYPLGLSGANDVIIRNLRVRPGNSSGETVDGMG